MFGYRNSAGAVVVDGQQIGQTLQCVHCGSHHTIIQGSGVQRGWCNNCKGFVCGEQGCMKCTPFEARLDLTEALAEGHNNEALKITGRYEGIKPF